MINYVLQVWQGRARHISCMPCKGQEHKFWTWKGWLNTGVLCLACGTNTNNQPRKCGSLFCDTIWLPLILPSRCGWNQRALKLGIFSSQKHCFTKCVNQTEWRCAFLWTSEWKTLWRIIHTGWKMFLLWNQNCCLLKECMGMKWWMVGLSWWIEGDGKSLWNTCSCNTMTWHMLCPRKRMNGPVTRR